MALLTYPCTIGEICRQSRVRQTRVRDQNPSSWLCALRRSPSISEPNSCSVKRACPWHPPQRPMGATSETQSSPLHFTSLSVHVLWPL